MTSLLFLIHWGFLNHNFSLVHSIIFLVRGSSPATGLVIFFLYYSQVQNSHAVSFGIDCRVNDVSFFWTSALLEVHVADRGRAHSQSSLLIPTAPGLWSVPLALENCPLPTSPEISSHRISSEHCLETQLTVTTFGNP